MRSGPVGPFDEKNGIAECMNKSLYSQLDHLIQTMPDLAAFTLPREALAFGPIVLLGGLGLTVLIIFFKNLRSEAARGHGPPCRRPSKQV